VSILKRPATSYIRPEQFDPEFTAEGLMSKAAEPFATQLMDLRWSFDTTSGVYQKINS
jgi:hypothetical protein